MAKLSMLIKSRNKKVIKITKPNPKSTGKGAPSDVVEHFLSYGDRKKKKFHVREYNRCPLCGRARSYYRKFNMCRICLRDRARKGELPGVTKSSW